MADHVTGFHTRYYTVINVQIRTANRARCHLNDGITRMLNLRVWHRIAAYIVLAVPT